MTEDLKARLDALQTSSAEARQQEARAAATAEALAIKVTEIEQRFKDEFGTEPSKAQQLLEAVRAECEDLVATAELELEKVESK